MVVTEANIVTNHYLTEGEKYGIGSEQSHMRFDTLTTSHDSTDGVMEHFELLNMMKSVAQFNYPQTKGSYEKTMWTVIYHPEALTMDFYYGENYEHCHIIELVSKNSAWIRQGF